ncbi:hypothetical protein [Methanomethylovorans sp.]|uniref:hypothetical protein n=1 Tax=Methanomethylovorans sp. TaxID=2758717 RepID=UPI00351C67DA
MENRTSSNIDPSLSAWARDLYHERKESVDYLLKFGNPLEKALINKVVELAKGSVE